MNGKRRRARKRRGAGRLVTGLLVLVPCLVGAVAAIVFLPSLGPDAARPPEWVSLERPDRSDRTTAVVATDVLNVRASASVDSAILAAYPNGQRVTIAGEPVNGFLPVEYGTDRAWMAAEFLSVGAESVADGWRSQVLVEDVVAAGPRGSDVAVLEPVLGPETADPEPVSAEPDVIAAEVDDGPAPVVEDADAGGERWIEVDRDTATVILHEGTSSVATFHGKVGRDPSDDGYYATALGTFHVYSMSKELAPTPFADDVYLTDWVGFDPERNNGFHSPVRDASGVEKAVQNPTTLGCVRLDAAAAEQVFAFAHIGMRVEIHD